MNIFYQKVIIIENNNILLYLILDEEAILKTLNALTMSQDKLIFVSVAMIPSISFLPFSIKSLLQRYALWHQNLYNKVLLYLLEVKVTSFIIIKIHTMLFYFRYYCVKAGAFVEQYMSLNMAALIIATICSRLHVAGTMIIFCLLFIRLESAVMQMLRFYKQYPFIFDRNFPKAKTNTKGMWTSAQRVAKEAASNPQVQAVGVAVIGALSWKALDVYDTQAQKEISEADRLAETARHKESLEAETVRHKESLEAEAMRHKEDLKAEAEQREKDRVSEAEQREKDRAAEARRMAFEKMTSPEFATLSEDQQAFVKEIYKSGQL